MYSEEISMGIMDRIY